MTAKKNTKKTVPSIIIKNRKARHDFFIAETVEAGLMLQGWEVKSLRSNKVQLRDAYISINGYEAKTLGLLISPLASASTHIEASPSRSRKLLLKKKEIDKIRGAIDRKGMTAVILSLY